MQNKVFRLACVSGGLAVMLGAFGAHALAELLAENGTADTYKTAVLYHFVHTLLLVAMSLSPFHEQRAVGRLRVIIVLGLLCFSGSLYLLSTLQWSWLGPITPIGGLLLIIGWIYSAITVRRSTS